MSSTKIGYVNSSILLERYEGAKEAREKIDKQTGEWQANIRTLEAELSQLNKDIVAKSNEWDKETLESKQEALKDKQEEMLRYSRATAERKSRLERDLMQPVLDTLNAYMKDFGQQRGYDIVFGTVAGGNILFAQESRDLTHEFLAYVSEREK